MSVPGDPGEASAGIARKGGSLEHCRDNRARKDDGIKPPLQKEEARSEPRLG
jgi:hypothetical protein